MNLIVWIICFVIIAVASYKQGYGTGYHEATERWTALIKQIDPQELVEED